jgi:hypothetical protein
VSKRALKRLQKFQKNLYEKAFQEASHHPLIDAPTIIKYSEHFYESLPKNFKKTEVDSILDDLDASDFLLYGDFHTLKQTQKGLVRLLKEYRHHQPERPIVLALEMFKARDQELIDRYLRGDLSETQFLQLCQYDHTWGFPWDNYKIILDFASGQNIRIVGINTDSAGKDQLRTRDRFAAKILQDIHAQNEQALVVCLIGEYHLADQHLPKHLTPQYELTRILTNIDHYYFLTGQSSAEAPATDYLLLKPRLYCILNSPPWIKWQSYAIWEEMKAVEGQIVDEGANQQILYTEETFDLDYQIFNLLTHLTEFLKVDFRKNDLTRFHTHLEPNETEVIRILKQSGLPVSQANHALERIDREGFYFIPQSSTILIGEINLNTIAEAAGQFLFSLLHPITNDMNQADQTYHRILMTSSGVLASKILNPRRHDVSRSDYEILLSQLQRRRLIGYQKKLRDATRLILRILNRLESGEHATLHHSAINYDHENQFELSTRLGQVIGYKTYQKIMQTTDSSIEFNYFFQFSAQEIAPKEHYTYLINCLYQQD